MNRLLLIDGNAIMHRAYHALPPLTSPDGKPVNVVYGFVSMMMKLYDRLHPTHVAVAFDRPGPTFRNKLFEGYQVQRPKAEDDFISQIPLVHDAVRGFGIPVYEADGFEADDVIGTIAKGVTRGAHPKLDQVVIVTGDRDILQLVEDDRILVFTPTKGLSEGALYGEKDVVARMGVLPKTIIDLKALMGDASDNYPGVTGIGPKTAIGLLDSYKTLDGIYDAVAKETGGIGEKTREKLLAGKDSAFLGKTLATIRTDAPVTPDIPAMKIDTLNTPGAQQVLETFHFTSLMRRLNGEPTVPKKPAKKPSKPDGSPKAHQEALFSL